MGISDSQSLKEQLAYQRKLNSITGRIHSASDTNSILLNLQGEILSLFDADRITIYMVDSKKKQIVSRLKTGDEVNEIRVSIDDNSIAGYCAMMGKAVNIFDVYDDDELKGFNPPIIFDRSWDQRTGYKTRQIVAAPIIYDKYLLGVIQLINKKDGNRFSEEDQSSVQDIAKVLGIAFFKNQKVALKARPTKFDLLVTDNIVTKKDLAEAMSCARKTKKPVEDVLMRDFQVSKDDIGRSLAGFYETSFIPYHDKMVISGHLLKGLRASYLKSNGFIPVARSGDRVTVAMEAPDDLPARDAIKRLVPAREYDFCVALKDDIHKMIEVFMDTGSIKDILGQLDARDEDYEEEADGIDGEDNAVVQFVNKIIVDANNMGASDIHIEPRQGKADVVIRVRIDGACQVYQTISYKYKRALVSRVKIMSDLDISERRLPQDGKIKFKKFGPLDIELRVVTIPTTGRNENVVMRILHAGDPVSLENMGMSQRNYDCFLDMITKPYGIAMLVGPTGSGKTTTLHAALSYINKPETKIWTAEDPVEITQEGICQVQVMPKIGFNFAAAMKAFLRADPDVIMVGEMRDQETMSIGIEASLTGHLVLTTLHTNSAPETITRLLDMGMDPFNFADAFLGVLAQRLVRTLCTDCKEKYHPSREEFDALVRAYGGDFDETGFEYTDDFFLYRPKGCRKCGNIGYRGRAGIHELLVGTDPIKSLIQGRARIEALRGQAITDGMTTLLQDGIQKICLGVTDLTQVRKVCIR